MSPSFVKICQDCGVVLSACPTCNDLRCRCPAPWSGTVRKHYDRNGEAYQLAPHLRIASDAELTAFRQREAEVRVMVRKGVSVDDIAEAFNVSRRTAFRMKAAAA